MDTYVHACTQTYIRNIISNIFCLLQPFRSYYSARGYGRCHTMELNCLQSNLHNKCMALLIVELKSYIASLRLRNLNSQNEIALSSISGLNLTKGFYIYIQTNYLRPVIN